ncbi:hypothetical protein [Paenibacillus thiaminolyticus]|uniref:hypothetical protein n=1 Tax=Paenibacillus thiaminolyticus TaxID=49283 RepID=UPI001603DB19|nr:hypothetical protein [Paenibacillus thiaminolyticus]
MRESFANCESDAMACSRLFYPHIKEAVDLWDPIGLLSLGAPSDEYDSLSLYITLLYAKRPDPDGMATQLERHMEEQFGLGPAVMPRERGEAWTRSIRTFCRRLLEDERLFERYEHWRLHHGRCHKTEVC